jgi:hypothetical protein
VLSNKSIIIAKTFTPYYSPLEDRIRLVINYADYANRVDFWITRAFILKLLPTWEEYFYTHAQSIEAQPLKNTEKHPSGTSSTNRSTLAVTQKEGVLLEAVDLTFVPEKKLFKVRMRGKGQSAIATLNEPLMMSVLASIFAAAPHYQWGISPSLLHNTVS